LPVKKLLIDKGQGKGVWLIVFYSDYRCNHNVTVAPAVVDQWPDDLRLTDLEPNFVCKVCGRRGANISGNIPPARMGIG